jgi:hypothetical protein
VFFIDEMGSLVVYPFLLFIYARTTCTVVPPANNGRERQKNHRKFPERQGFTLFSFFQPVSLGFASSLPFQPRRDQVLEAVVSRPKSFQVG